MGELEQPGVKEKQRRDRARAKALDMNDDAVSKAKAPGRKAGGQHVTTTGSRACVASRLVDRAPEELHPHAVYLEVRGPIRGSEGRQTPSYSATAAEPVAITRAGLILAGYTRWQLAVREGWPSLACIQYELSDEQAVLFMLDKDRRSDRLNDFCRILLALQLAPHWRARARQHQAGAGKLPSKLTKAGPIDVRAKIARAAGVGAGNVTKVTQLLETATPEVREALRRGEIRIHRAWQWRQLEPDRQNEQLHQYRHRKDIRHTIRHLLRKHQDEQEKVLTIEQFAGLIAKPTQGGLTHATLIVADLPGPAIIVTRDLYETLRRRSADDVPARATA